MGPVPHNAKQGYFVLRFLVKISTNKLFHFQCILSRYWRRKLFTIFYKLKYHPFLSWYTRRLNRRDIKRENIVEVGSVEFKSQRTGPPTFAAELSTQVDSIGVSRPQALSLSDSPDASVGWQMHNVNVAFPKVSV